MVPRNTGFQPVHSCERTQKARDRREEFFSCTGWKPVLQNPIESMSDTSLQNVREIVDSVYRSDSRRILATLIRVLGDFEVAEEAMHDAFAAAVEQWPSEGVPANPRAWLVSTARFKAIDRIRRRAKYDVSLEDVVEQIENIADANTPQDTEGVEDDRLRLIFTCCHPALA